MKAKLFVIGLFLFALAACIQKPQVPEPAVAEPSRSVEGPSLELQSIDTQMWRQPDSALTRLLPWFDTCCRDTARHVSTASTYNRHYANLLLSELLYKNDYPQTNRRELLQAVNYFDSLCLCKDVARNISTIAFLDARAHYINGVGYYENDSAVPACKEYMKALEVMEEHFEEKELVRKKAKFIAFTYTRLTEIFSDMYLHEQVIYFSKESLNYYDKYNVSSSHVAWILNAIGSNYDMMEQLDSADYYYKKAIHILGDTSTLMYRNIIAHQAYLKYKMDFHNANASISSLLNLLSETESVRETIIRYSYIGEILFHEKRFDSAWMYLNIVFQKAPDIGSKKQAAERLVEICKTQGREDEMLEYAVFLVPFVNQEENQSEIKSQMTELYKIYSENRLERLHQMETQKHAKRVISLIGSLLFVMLTIIILYVRNKRHKRKLETQIESERHTHKIQQAALAGRLKRSNAALKECGKITKTTTQLQNHAIEKYEDEPICQHILALCNDKKNPIKSTVPIAAYAKIALTDAQKAQLKDAAMHHYGSLFEKLKQQYPELKEKDLQYCYLSLLGLDNVEIAVVLQHSISTIWERENRLKKILGSRDRVAVLLHGLMIN